jgi:hypothetical protein
MNVFRNAGKLLATLIFVLAICAVANAQTSTFVASTGSDASAGCPRTAPCRTFQVAVNTVLPGGTVVALDSAGYGTLAIAKSVSIFAPSGVNAAVNATSGTAISITAGTVTLSGLQLNGSGTAANGISVTGGTAIVKNCDISAFGTGVSVTNTKLVLFDSTLYGNTTAINSSGAGTDNGATVSVAMVMVSRGSIVNNGTAFFQTNPGVGFQNIYVQLTSNSSGQWPTNIVNNTSIFGGTGTGCPCTGVGQYQASFGVK